MNNRKTIDLLEISGSVPGSYLSLSVPIGGGEYVSEKITIENFLNTVTTNYPLSGTLGDTLQADASGNYINLPIGNENDIYSVSGGIPQWIPHIENELSGNLGDLLYASSSGTFVNLPIGTSGQVLDVSSGLIPEWVNSVKYANNISGVLDLSGDIYFYGSSGNIPGFFELPLISGYAIAAYGTVSRAGAKLAGSANWTVAKNSTGHYQLNLTDSGNFIVIVWIGEFNPLKTIMAIHDPTTGFFRNNVASNIQTYYTDIDEQADLIFVFCAIKVA